MKFNYADKSQLTRITTAYSVPGIDRGPDDHKEPAKTTMTLSAVVAATIALYVVMFASAYLWGRYASVFPPDSVDGPAVVEAMPWAQ